MDRLIFGKNNAGIAEFQKYFSHIPGTINAAELNNDILLAQEELHKYVGKDVVEEALDHYYGDDFEVLLTVNEDESGSGVLTAEEVAALQLKDNLVYHVQMAVCLIGYREYALNNDATHTKTGRMARMDKENDTFTERLIDRDDIALLRKSQKAIERLIKFIDDNRLSSWITSNLYKETRDLILWNSDTFQRFYPIEYSYRLFMLLVPMIRSAQREFIAPVLGSERMAALMDRVKNNTINGDDSGSGATSASMLELYDYVGYVIAYFAIAAGYRDLPIQIFPENMSRQFWNAGNGLAFTGLRDKIIDSLQKEAQRKLQVLLAYVDKITAEETNTPITDDTITTIAERMSTTNKFARV